MMHKVVSFEFLEPVFWGQTTGFGTETPSSQEMLFPWPHTVYGMIRALYFQKHPEEVRRGNTDADPTKGVSILGLWWCNPTSGTRHFPAPLSLGTDEEDHPQWATPSALPSRWAASEPRLLDEQNLREYLRGKLMDVPKETIKRKVDLCLLEARVGIHRQRVNGPRSDSSLYAVPFRRHVTESGHRWHLEALINDPDNKIEEGRPTPLKVGRDGRLTRAQVVPMPEDLEWLSEKEGDSFGLWFALTPIGLNQGQPQATAAFTGRASTIHGWNAQGRTNFSTVYPAGSVLHGPKTELPRQTRDGYNLFLAVKDASS